MKKNIMGALLMLMALIPQTNMAAPGNGTNGEEFLPESQQVIQEYQTTEVITGNNHKDYYKTWHVVKVTGDEITLERTKSNGEVDNVNIARSRRPYLKAGDKVRYDKIRNRLRKTLDE